MGFRDIIIYALVGALVAPSQQQPAPPAEGAKAVEQQKAVEQPKGTLAVSVVQGDGARNSIESRSAVAPVVEVKDPDGKPAVGAEVVFQLPLAGPSGLFNGWLRLQTVRTDESGKATVTGYAPNTEAGRFDIKVTATAGSQTGTAVISQTNVESNEESTAPIPAAPAAKAKKPFPWKIVGPIIGAAAILIVVAVVLRGDD